jgi:hypothetical protein
MSDSNAGAATENIHIRALIVEALVSVEEDLAEQP